MYALHSITKFFSNICLPYGNNERFIRINRKLVLGEVNEINCVENSGCFFWKISYLVERLANKLKK